MMGLLEAARLGIGIALLPDYIVDPLIETDDLVALDVGAAPASGEATALFPRARAPSAAVRRLIDFTIAALAQGPVVPSGAVKRRRRRADR
jgi:DNA-binding transcriptional LysR family regulator